MTTNARRDRSHANHPARGHDRPGHITVRRDADGRAHTACGLATGRATLTPLAPAGDLCPDCATMLRLDAQITADLSAVARLALHGLATLDQKGTDR